MLPTLQRLPAATLASRCGLPRSPLLLPLGPSSLPARPPLLLPPALLLVELVLRLVAGGPSPEALLVFAVLSRPSLPLPPLPLQTRLTHSLLIPRLLPPAPLH